MLKISNIVKSEKPPRVCTFDVRISSEYGEMEIKDCSYWKKSEISEWISLPARTYEKEGQVKYISQIKFDKEKEFKEALMKSIKLELMK